MGKRVFVRKKKRRVSGAADYVLPTILGVGALVGIVWLVKNGGFSKILESGANTDNNKTVDQNTQAAGQKLPTLNTTLSDAALSGIATSIYNAGSSNDGSAVAHELQLLGNTADFNRLYQLFGTKQGSTSMFSTCNLLGFDCQSLDLYAWVNSILSTDQRDEVNSLLSANGINAQF